MAVGGAKKSRQDHGFFESRLIGEYLIKPLDKSIILTEPEYFNGLIDIPWLKCFVEAGG